MHNSISFEFFIHNRTSELMKCPGCDVTCDAASDSIPAHFSLLNCVQKITVWILTRHWSMALKCNV